VFLILTLAVLSVVSTFIATPFLRDHIGHVFVDRPDGVRKKHPTPVPRVGGIAIALCYAGTFVGAFFMPFSYSSILHGALPSILRMAVPASLVFLLGVIDDLFGCNAWQKLLGIGAAGAVAVWAGVRVDIHLLPFVSSQVWLSVAITILWLVGCTNAFNLIDGMDGLAAGAGLFAVLALLVAALAQGNLRLVLAMVPLGGCLLGFLRYNFSPASVFLGDSGSLLVGFLLGCYGAVWSEKSVTLVALTGPLLALSIPLVDVALSILRRFLRSRPIFEGDHGHIHHKLLECGFSPRKAVLILYGCCAIAATLSLLVGSLNNQFSGLIVVAFCVGTYMGIRRLGYQELSRAGHMFLKGGFQRVIDVETRLSDLEATLRAARDLDQSWMTIRAGSRQLGFCGVRMSIAGRIFEELNHGNNDLVWQVRIPLPDEQYINFFRKLDCELEPVLLPGFVTCIERGLRDRLVFEAPELETVSCATVASGTASEVSHPKAVPLSASS
jgi:UDP-GlcNAc:undecaprenyl-phosphate GlcNAc-1-phosphate transferase